MSNLPEGTTVKRHWRTRFIWPLLTVMLVMGVFALSGAQVPVSNPGQTDPVGPPASYIMLRNDNLAPSYVASGGDNVFNTYEANDLRSPDALQLASNHVPSGGGSSFISAAGRILTQDRDQLVMVGRSGSVANALKVRFAAGGDYGLSDLHDRLADAPDQISAAVGDLDKIPDANGANHDEVVVAYAENNGAVNVAVLNYTATNANGSNPLYVTQALAPFTVNFHPAPYFAGQGAGFKVSELLAVAIGDFDGDGQNELVLATLDPVQQDQLNMSIFRYVHPTLSAPPQLQLVKTQSFPDVASNGRLLVPTISLAAGDFLGTGKRAELVLGTRTWEYSSDWNIDYRMQTLSFDDNLNPTITEDGVLDRRDLIIDGSVAQDAIPPLRILCLPGLLIPDVIHNLYRRAIVVVWNDSTSAGDDTLNIATFFVNDTLGVDQQYGQQLQIANQGVYASFAATVGAFGVNGNIASPLWSLAVETVQSPAAGAAQNEAKVYLFPNDTTNGSGLTYGRGKDEATAFRSFESQCNIAVCDSTTQNALRPAIQAYDYQGRTLQLGAPIMITVPKLITTDFVLQDPPKHAYWDEKNQKLVVVSRIPGIAVSMTNKDGVTYSGKSTDTSASSIGGSEAATASASIKSDALGIFKVNVSAEVTAKLTYNYDFNKTSYNSSYSSRVLTENESTVEDDFVSGRYQQLTIWRYRLLGENRTEAAGKTLNLYYDAVFPGPSVAFKASGLDLDWYQPRQEPGNILSYPAPSNDTFHPSDIGTYYIPCPSKATDCQPNGTKAVSGPMIPATEESISGTSGSIALNYVNTSGSGDQVGYQHKLGTSQDVKISYSASVGLFGGEAGGNFATNLNSSNSWGNTTTSDSTSTSETGVTITRAAIGSAHAYNIFPTLYTTLDGTIKAAFAADPMGSSAGKIFWAGLYGKLPDPALNLPLRFEQSGSNWVVNDLSSRKQMRGFFVLSKDPDPVTGQYDILGQAPVAGEAVRLSAQVYNYSTAKSFTDCLVQFLAIKYDSNSDTEEGTLQDIGSTHISLGPRATGAAQITWDTTKFAPPAGGASQDYRIYVRLNYDGKITEIYPPEDPKKTYLPGLPGVDPGQNDEGFGLATVVAPAVAASSSSPAVTFSSTPLAAAAAINVANGPVTTSPLVSTAVPLRLRAQVCSTANTRDQVDVVVFDGDPSDGKVIAWKRIYAPGSGQCKGTWFQWRPTRGDHNLVATVEPVETASIVPNNASLMAESSPRRASFQIHVP